MATDCQYIRYVGFFTELLLDFEEAADLFPQRGVSFGIVPWTSREVWTQHSEMSYSETSDRPRLRRDVPAKKRTWDMWVTLLEVGLSWRGRKQPTDLGNGGQVGHTGAARVIAREPAG